MDSGTCSSLTKWTHRLVCREKLQSPGCSAQKGAEDSILCPEGKVSHDEAVRETRPEGEMLSLRSPRAIQATTPSQDIQPERGGFEVHIKAHLHRR